MRSSRRAARTFFAAVLVVGAPASAFNGDPGPLFDLVDQFSGAPFGCSTGLAFNGLDQIWSSRCSDQSVYDVGIDVETGLTESSGERRTGTFLNALAHDLARGSLWATGAFCSTRSTPSGPERTLDVYRVPVENGPSTAVHAFSIPQSLTNPATGQSFLPPSGSCLSSAITHDPKDPLEPADDEIYVAAGTRNIGVFDASGNLLRGYDAFTVTSGSFVPQGLALAQDADTGELRLYLSGGSLGKIVRAAVGPTSLSFVSVFFTPDPVFDLECGPDPVDGSPAIVTRELQEDEDGNPDDVAVFRETDDICMRGSVEVGCRAFGVLTRTVVPTGLIPLLRQASIIDANPPFEPCAPDQEGQRDAIATVATDVRPRGFGKFGLKNAKAKATVLSGGLDRGNMVPVDLLEVSAARSEIELKCMTGGRNVVKKLVNEVSDLEINGQRIPVVPPEGLPIPGGVVQLKQLDLFDGQGLPVARIEDARHIRVVPIRFRTQAGTVRHDVEVAVSEVSCREDSGEDSGGAR